LTVLGFPKTSNIHGVTINHIPSLYFVLERGGQIELVANLKEIFVRVTPPLVNEYCQVFFYFVLEHVMRRAGQV
jgi:hypothetical protein